MTTDVEGRVRAMYAAKASQVAADDHGAAHDPSGVEPVSVAEPGRRPRRFAAVGIAAAVLVVMSVAVGVLATRGDDAPSRRRVTTEPIPPDETKPESQPGLAPTTFPPGLQLSYVIDQHSDGTTGFEPTELFGRLDTTGAPSPGVLLRMQPSQGGSTAGQAVTVRGIAGASGAPKEGVGARFTISWIEGDTAIDAVVRGMNRADAIAFLNSMTRRGTSPMQGFDATALPILGEQLTAPASARNLTYQYATTAGPAPTDHPPLEIVTQPRSSYPGYLGLWIQGNRNPDGSITVRDPGWGFDLAWPDGRQVFVNSATDDWPQLEQVARGVETTPGADIDKLITVADNRLQQLPDLGHARHDDTTATLRGTNGPLSVCVDAPVAQTCSSPFTGEFVTSYLDHGTWKVVVASQVPVQIAGSTDFRDRTDIAVHVTASGWDFAFATPPPDATQIEVRAGPDHLSGYGVVRPTS